MSEESQEQQVKQKAKMGRPSKRTPKTVEELLVRISMGRSVANVCTDEDMPDARTVFRWIAENEDFRQAYARACANRSLVYADTIGDIAKGVMAGKIPPDAGRVAIDSYKWIAARLMPKYYGEKQLLEASVTHTHTLHLGALKQLAEEAKQSRAKVIEADPVPQLPQVQQVWQVGHAEAESQDAGFAETPPAPGGGGGALVRGATSPHTAHLPHGSNGSAGPHVAHEPHLLDLQPVSTDASAYRATGGDSGDTPPTSGTKGATDATE